MSTLVEGTNGVLLQGTKVDKKATEFTRYWDGFMTFYSMEMRERLVSREPSLPSLVVFSRGNRSLARLAGATCFSPFLSWSGAAISL